MIDLLNRFIIFSFNDSAIGFFSNMLRYIGMEKFIEKSNYVLYKTTLIDLIPSYSDAFLSHFLPFVFLNNLFVFISFVLNLYFGYKLFLWITKNKAISLIFSLVNASSLYYLYRVISATPALYFTFTITLTLYLLIKNSSLFSIILACVGAFLFSDYYGYFSVGLTVMWFTYDLLFYKNSRKKSLKKLGIFLVTIPLTLFIMFPSLVINHLPFNLPKHTSTQDTTQTVVYRPIEDWYSFSYRPWYFLIPPQDSIYFGDLSTQLYKRIASTGYYLNDNYIDQEMGGSYMGWHLILGVIATLILLFTGIRDKVKGRIQFLYSQRELILKVLIIGTFIVLIASPPIFTVAGIKIYTPSYILFNIVPYFRSLVRWSSVIFLLVLIPNAILTTSIVQNFKKLHLYLGLSFFLLLNYVIFAIRIPIIDTNKVPPELAYIRENTTINTGYLVFPTGNYDQIFWASVINRKLDNPRDLEIQGESVDIQYFKDILLGKDVNNQNEPAFLVYYHNDVSGKTIKRINSILPEIEDKEQLKNSLDSMYGKPVFNVDTDVYVYKLKGQNNE